jgi:hypothetical protein
MLGYGDGPGALQCVGPEAAYTNRGNRIWNTDMAGHFDITLSPDDCLVRLTMSGFFEPEEIRRLGEEMVAAVARLHCPPNQHLTLCDIREMAIQSQDAVGHFTRLVGAEPIRSRMLAFVTAKSLARLQARRLTDRADVEFFDTVAAAEAWLGVPRDG